MHQEAFHLLKSRIATAPGRELKKADTHRDFSTVLRFNTLTSFLATLTVKFRANSTCALKSDDSSILLYDHVTNVTVFTRRF